MPLSGTAPVQSNSFPDSALMSSGHATVIPEVSSLLVELIRDLRLEPVGVERLAARDRDDGDTQQDGGANEP